MRVLIAGASGTIGRAVAAELGQRHEIISAGRRSGEVRMDITDGESIRTAFEELGAIDALVSTTGTVKLAPFANMEVADYEIGLRDKLLGQLNLVLIGRHYLSDAGSFTLTTGVLDSDPIRMGTSASMVNGAINAFVMAADVRTLPHQDEAYVRRELDRLIDGLSGVSYDIDIWAVSNSSPADDPFVDLMKRSTEKVLNQGIIMIPQLTVGFTDSRCVRPLGTHTYGFAPVTPDSDTIRPGVHGINEAMEISNLLFLTKTRIALACLALQGSMP